MKCIGRAGISARSDFSVDWLKNFGTLKKILRV